MTEVARDGVAVSGTRAEIWAILDDPDALARVMPATEALAFDGPDRFHGVIAAKVGLFTIRVDVKGSLVDPRRPDAIRLTLDGTPRGIGGSFALSCPIELSALDDARTRVDYHVDLTTAGGLASLGDRVVGGGLGGLIATLIANVDAELIRRRAEGPGAGR